VEVRIGCCGWSALPPAGDARGREARHEFARSVEAARALRASVLLQSPPSFTPDPEKDLARFLSEVDRNGLTLVWEPRGRWGEELERLPDRVLELDADLVYVLFNNDTMAADAQRFTRMWGER